MKLRSLFGMLLSLLTLVMFGCGGNGGGTPTTVSGEASKGPIIGGDVKIFAIDAKGVVQTTALPTTPVTVTTHGAFGNYSAVINYSGAVKVVVTGNPGSTYLDEATGNPVDFAGKSLSAVVADVRGSAKVAVTPYTELAVQSQKDGVFTKDNIEVDNKGVAEAFGLIDDKGLAIDIINASPSKNALYKFKLAVISHDLQNSGLDVTTRLAEIATKIDAVKGSITDETLNTAITDATHNAFDNPAVVPVGTTPPIDPATVGGIKIAAPGTQAINTQAAITATVTRIDGAPSVGTTVSFAVTTGTGTLSAATATTDASGVATVNLTSAAEEAVAVTASAGNSKRAFSVTFANPNKPGAITLVAAPASGVINALSPVTLTATVTPVDTVTGVLPTGTVVTFNVVTGTGTITAATTTNASGVATAILNSTVVGKVTVNATAGTAPVVTSANLDVPFISQPTLAIVTMATSGTLPTGALVGGVNAVVTFTPPTFTIADADVAFAGPGLGLGTLSIATTATAGQITLAMINAGQGTNVINATGEFCTLKFHVPVGTFIAPTVAIAAGSSVIDTAGVAIPGVTVVIKSVTLQ